MLNFNLVDKEFVKYVKNYDSNHGKVNLKIVHTYGVVRASEFIAKDLGLSDEDIELAKIIALLHDIGRFEQIRIYNDFRDYMTEDHANLGCKVLFKDGLIEKMISDRSYDDIIFKAISNHNKLAIESGLNERQLLHAKIIRDADKTDIFRVTCDDKVENIVHDATEEDMKNNNITDKVYNDFMSDKIVLHQDRKTYIDFWISYIAFIYDYNFTSGLRYIYQKDYINKMIDKFDYKNPDTKEKMEKIKNHALEYLRNRLDK